MTAKTHTSPSYVVRYQAATRGHSHPSHRSNGVVLIVSLVILAIMTVIAVGTVTDVSFQSNMVRNSQISLNAFNMSMSELNAQFQTMKDDEDFTRLAGIVNTNTTITLLDSEILQASTDNPFKQEFTISLIDDDDPVATNMGGFELRPAPSGGNAHFFEFNSISKLENTAIKSDQTYGITYPKTGG